MTAKAVDTATLKLLNRRQSAARYLSDLFQAEIDDEAEPDHFTLARRQLGQHSDDPGVLKSHELGTWRWLLVPFRVESDRYRGAKGSAVLIDAAPVRDREDPGSEGSIISVKVWQALERSEEHLAGGVIDFVDPTGTEITRHLTGEVFPNTLKGPSASGAGSRNQIVKTVHRYLSTHHAEHRLGQPRT